MRTRLLRPVGPPAAPVVRRVAMLSLHTSPMAQPGSGDAGGLNVYVREVGRRLAERGVAVEMFTRRTAGDQPPTVRVDDGVTLHHIGAGPEQFVDKTGLASQLCALTAGVLRREATRPPGWFDIVHSHYWLSGQVGWVATERWDVPLVHSMHTMALVKNRDLRPGDAREPMSRIVGEQQVVAAADRLVANTSAERDDLVSLYGAEPQRVDVIHPGVDRVTFTPGDQRAARRHLGLDPDRDLVVYVGRLQALKAPDVVVAAAPLLDPVRPVTVVICGGPSGNGAIDPERLRSQAAALGVSDGVVFWPPLPTSELAQLYRAATVVVVPSHNESFGLVAAEAQSCGTPVVATAVGGLTTVVAHDRSGLLVTGHDPAVWARAIDRVRLSPRLRTSLSAGAVTRAQTLGWDATASGLLGSYGDALLSREGAQWHRREA